MVTSFLSSLVLVLIPFLVGLVCYIYQCFLQRLPTAQRAALHQFSTYAVQKVEQQYADIGSAQKKQLAYDALTGLFKSFGLPIPAAHAIDVSIESAVYELSQEHLDLNPLSGQKSLPWVSPTIPLNVAVKNPTEQQG
jgi:Bacteriophage holin of superfamily 6 (Holin_LLH)